MLGWKKNEKSASSAENALSGQELHDHLIKVLRTIYDPEIPVNIYDLGLIYRVESDDDGVVAIDMTLTAPNCPAAEQLPVEIKAKVRAVPGVRDVKLEIVWEPPWTQEMMSDAARLDLGL